MNCRTMEHMHTQVTNKKRKVTREKLEKLLGISETVSTTNVHLFDSAMTMKRSALLPHGVIGCLHAHTQC